MYRPLLRLVSNPSVAQVDAAVAVCCKAYENDVAMNIMVGWNKSLYEALWRAMFDSAAIGGEVLVVVEADKVVGTSLWFKPGFQIFGLEDQRKLGFNQFLEKLDPDTHRWWTTTYKDDCGRFLNKVLGETGVLDSWYANSVAVEEEYRRRGIATMMVNHVYDEAVISKSFLALCTQNDLNVTIYEHMGFKSLGHTDLYDYEGKNHFDCYCLTRGQYQDQSGTVQAPPGS